MTNEETIAWLEHHFDPLPDGTKQSEAVSLAIKALETIPKYKDAYNKGWDDGAKATYEHLKMCEEEKEPKTDVLDKIRAEIEQMNNIDYVEPITVDEVLQIIDKYKAESEE